MSSETVCDGGLQAQAPWQSANRAVRMAPVRTLAAEVWGKYSEVVVGSRRGADMKEQPGGLQVIEATDVFE